MRKLKKIKPFCHSEASKKEKKDTFCSFSPSWGKWPICVYLNKYKWCKMKGWVICYASSHRRRSQVPRRGENIEIRISEKKTFQYRSNSSLPWSRGEGWLARGSALFVGFDTCEQIWLFENHGIQFEWKICINRFRQMRERLEEVNCLYICLDKKFYRFSNHWWKY